MAVAPRPSVALLIVDLQEDFLTRAGPWKRPVSPARLLAPVGLLVRGARQRSIPVGWACRGASPIHPPALRALGADDPVFRRGSASALTDDVLGWLAAHGADQLVLAGVSTDDAIRSTGLAASARGLSTTVAVDAVGAPTGQGHRDGLGALAKAGVALRSAVELASAWKVRVEGLGAGDSALHLGLLDGESCREQLASVRDEVSWQPMLHRGGRVPRDVAIQGVVADGAEPLYRHPVDEQPSLGPFTPQVDALRRTVESVIGQALNHALLQRYPTRDANISLHADKTLDVLRGSQIVNLSLGATRTLLLQHKQRRDDGGFDTHRVELPHGSVFVLGWQTNREYRHGIRPDRRAPGELRRDESVGGGERISITFRTIATFRDPSGVLFGQGARDPGCPPRADERAALLEAFGVENLDPAFDWDQAYGGGFDLVNFATRPVAPESRGP